MHRSVGGEKSSRLNRERNFRGQQGPGGRPFRGEILHGLGARCGFPGRGGETIKRNRCIARRVGENRRSWPGKTIRGKWGPEVWPCGGEILHGALARCGYLGRSEKTIIRSRCIAQWVGGDRRSRPGKKIQRWRGLGDRRCGGKILHEAHTRCGFPGLSGRTIIRSRCIARRVGGNCRNRPKKRSVGSGAPGVGRVAARCCTGGSSDASVWSEWKDHHSKWMQRAAGS